MIEKTIQDKYIKMLNSHRLPFVHVKNAGQRTGVYHDCLGQPCTKHFPDIAFGHNGKFHVRELAVECTIDDRGVAHGRHADRKNKQMAKGVWWAKATGGTFKVIKSLEELYQDFAELGLIK
jgi:hypothetical protein